MGRRGSIPLYTPNGAGNSIDGEEGKSE